MKRNSLAEFRASIQMTQRELAESIGVSRNYIALVERGEKPFSAKLQEKLSRLSLSGASPHAQAPPTMPAAAVGEPAPPSYAGLVHVASGSGSVPTKPRHCADCARKDLEIERLNRIVDNLSTALAKK